MGLVEEEAAEEEASWTSLAPKSSSTVHRRRSVAPTLADGSECQIRRDCVFVEETSEVARAVFASTSFYSVTSDSTLFDQSSSIQGSNVSSVSSRPAEACKDLHQPKFKPEWEADLSRIYNNLSIVQAYLKWAGVFLFGKIIGQTFELLESLPASHVGAYTTVGWVHIAVYFLLHLALQKPHARQSILRNYDLVIALLFCLPTLDINIEHFAHEFARASPRYAHTAHIQMKVALWQTRNCTDLDPVKSFEKWPFPTSGVGCENQIFKPFGMMGLNMVQFAPMAFRTRWQYSFVTSLIVILVTAINAFLLHSRGGIYYIFWD